MRKEKEKKVNSLQASVRTLQTALEEKEASEDQWQREKVRKIS